MGDGGVGRRWHPAGPHSRSHARLLTNARSLKHVLIDGINLPTRARACLRTPACSFPEFGRKAPVCRGGKQIPSSPASVTLAHARMYVRLSSATSRKTQTRATCREINKRARLSPAGCPKNSRSQGNVAGYFFSKNKNITFPTNVYFCRGRSERGREDLDLNLYLFSDRRMESCSLSRISNDRETLEYYVYGVDPPRINP